MEANSKLVRMRFPLFITVILVLTTCIALALRADLSQEFLPRQIAMHGYTRLIVTHVILDVIVGLSALYSAIFIFFLVGEKRDMYFRGILFAFACFLFCISLTRVMAIIDIWITWYWIEALTKAMTAFCGVAIMITLPVTVRTIMMIRTPDEYRQMIEETKALRRELNELKEWKQRF